MIGMSGPIALRLCPVALGACCRIERWTLLPYLASHERIAPQSGENEDDHHAGDKTTPRDSKRHPVHRQIRHLPSRERGAADAYRQPGIMRYTLFIKVLCLNGFFKSPE